MKAPVVIVGLGEMGGVFARALLRAGHPVFPVNRGQSWDEMVAQVPEPALVLICVAEADLSKVLESLPAGYRSRVGLVQNELMPCEWEPHGVVDPTVAIVWFEKKKGTSEKPILSSPVCGPFASATVDALAALDLPAHEVTESALLFELAKKNLYILTANIAGLEVGGTVGALWANHRPVTERVSLEVLEIEQWRARKSLPKDDLLGAMRAAFDADPEHKATGRSAPERLSRLLGRARKAGIATPELTRIASAAGLLAGP